MAVMSLNWQIRARVVTRCWSRVLAGSTRGKAVMAQAGAVDGQGLCTRGEGSLTARSGQGPDVRRVWQ